MDLSDILVIKLVPLAIDHILTVGYVMPTCNRKHSAAETQSADKIQALPEELLPSPWTCFCFAHTPLVLAPFCHTLTRRTYCLLCHDGRWLTVDHRWWSGRHTPWPGKASDPALPRGRRRDCWSWRNTSPHAGTVSSGCRESKRPKTEYQSTVLLWVSWSESLSVHLIFTRVFCLLWILLAHQKSLLVYTELCHQNKLLFQFYLYPLYLLKQSLLKEKNQESRHSSSPLVAGGLCSTLLHSSIWGRKRNQLWEHAQAKGHQKARQLSGCILLTLKFKTDPDFSSNKFRLLATPLSNEAWHEQLVTLLPSNAVATKPHPYSHPSCLFSPLEASTFSTSPHQWTLKSGTLEQGKADFTWHPAEEMSGERMQQNV